MLSAIQIYSYPACKIFGSSTYLPMLLPFPFPHAFDPIHSCRANSGSNLWRQLPRRAAENFYPFLQNVPLGPRRQHVSSSEKQLCASACKQTRSRTRRTKRSLKMESLWSRRKVMSWIIALMNLSLRYLNIFFLSITVRYCTRY